LNDFYQAADNRNLIAFSHDGLLATGNVVSQDRHLLQADVPYTQWVTPNRSNAL
jgi:hypothetical protein